MDTAFGILGFLGFIFGLSAYSKVTKLEKALERKSLDAPRSE
jgi:hypothetical protein